MPLTEVSTIAVIVNNYIMLNCAILKVCFSDALSVMNIYMFLLMSTQNSFLDELFEGLQTLCNLFVVKAENLPQVCSEEPYVCTYVPTCMLG